MKRKTWIAAAGVTALSLLAAGFLLEVRHPVSEPLSNTAGMEGLPSFSSNPPADVGDDSPERRMAAMMRTRVMQSLHELAGRRQDKLIEKLSLTSAQQIQLRQAMDARLAGVKAMLERNDSDPALLEGISFLRRDRADPSIAALLTPDQSTAYDAMAAAACRIQTKSAAMRQLGTLVSVIDDLTPEQRDAAYQAFIDHGSVSAELDLFEALPIKSLWIGHEPQPVEELRSVLSESQYRRYVDHVARN
jgi:hypothetical protein